MEVANGGFFGGTSTDAEGLVLEDLEFVNVVFGGVREPNRTGIGGDGAEEGVVGGEERDKIDLIRRSLKAPKIMDLKVY